jgi:hypothetical protein
MKKILLPILLVLTPCIMIADRLERRIDKLVKPYQGALDFITALDPVHQVNDHDVFVFFNQNQMHKKQDLRNLKSTVRIIKRIACTKKSLPQTQSKIAVLLHDLGRVIDFIENYATTYAGLITYYEITACYYYIDEQHADVVNLLMNQSDKLGLPSMQKRGLYKFVKKIDLDVRRLTALFTRNIISDDLVVKMNQTKTKLLTLKSKIIVSKDYKVQHSKTRWLKTFGVLIVPVFVFGVAYGAAIFWAMLSGTQVCEVGTIVTPILYPTLFVTTLGITAQELRQSSKYNIPVHSTSLFSLFTPLFLLFTWIPRG